MVQQRQWQSRVSAILASTGAAVGLGNIWKFPYMVGTYGGSAFLFIYLVAVLIVGIPLMMAEMSLGRLGQANPVKTFKKLTQSSKGHWAWRWVGHWSQLTLMVILSFYSVVAGWSLYYLFLSLSGGLLEHAQAWPITDIHQAGLPPEGLTTLWQHYVQSVPMQITSHTLFMVLTMWVVSRGVKAGLERAGKIMLPLLFLILLMLMFYGMKTPGFHQAWHFLFDLNLHAINTEVTISALGHAFFTLAVGACCLLVYGSYTPNHIPLTPTIMTIAGLDVGVALMSGLAIFSLVFTFHLPVGSGPGLMFHILPIAFANMHYGMVMAPLFFMLLFFAAWSSSISLAEPLVLYVVEHYRIHRRMASCWVGALAWLLGLLSALSESTLSFVKLFHRSLFLCMTDLATNILLPIGGLAIIVFTGYVLKRSLLESALTLPPFYFSFWYTLMRRITPCAILIILCSGLGGGA